MNGWKDNRVNIGVTCIAGSVIITTTTTIHHCRERNI
jgi:hypothetical protein